jgi:hypothetical protein
LKLCFFSAFSLQTNKSIDRIDFDLICENIGDRLSNSHLFGYTATEVMDDLETNSLAEVKRGLTSKTLNLLTTD